MLSSGLVSCSYLDYKFPEAFDDFEFHGRRN